MFTGLLGLCLQLLQGKAALLAHAVKYQTVLEGESLVRIGEGWLRKGGIGDGESELRKEGCEGIILWFSLT